MSVIVRQAVRGGSAELVVRIDTESYINADDAGDAYVIYEPLTLNQVTQLLVDLSVIVAGECKNW